MALKPIETCYRGNLYRSRLEARFAVLFDTLGLRYQYEREGYDLGDGLYYLPDFDLGTWFAEIKGDTPTARERLLAQRLCEQSGKRVCVLVGSCDPMTMDVLMYVPACDKERRITPVTQGFIAWAEHLDRRVYEAQVGPIPDVPDPELIMLLTKMVHPVRHAYKMAQRARFEHGASPAA